MNEVVPCIIIATFAILVAVERAHRSILRRLDQQMDATRHEGAMGVSKRFAEIEDELTRASIDAARSLARTGDQQREISEVRKALSEIKERSAYR